MTRLHHPVSIPGLLGYSETPGFPLVLDSDGDVVLGNDIAIDFNEVMKWQSVWTAGAYEAGDVVTDGSYLMVANKDTTDRPAPQPVGPPEDGISPTPTWDTLSPTVTYLGSGTRFQITQGGWINSWRVWIPTVSANNIYVVTLYDNTDPAHIIETSISITPTETGWYEVLVKPTVVLPGQDFLLVLYAQNNAGFAPHSGPWDYLGQSQPANDPGVGNFNRNNSGTIVRINSTDQNALDRDGELAEILPGVELNIEDGEWIVRVNSSTDMGGWWEFNVATQSGGLPNTPDGVKVVAWEIANPQPTDYVKSDLYWDTNQPTFATASGIYTEEPITGVLIDTPLQTYVEPSVLAVEDSTAYGADFEFQAATISEDWDIMATSEGGGSGGSSNTFVSLVRGLAIADQISSNAFWTDYGNVLNMGTTYGEDAWINAVLTLSAFSVSNVATSYRIRIGISVDAGSSWDFGKEPWGTTEVDSRRQAITATHFLDMGDTAGQSIHVKAQILFNSGVSINFQEGSLIANMAKTNGRT